jgi:RNA polymerase sigma factor (TIGR02999 family)
MRRCETGQAPKKSSEPWQQRLRRVGDPAQVRRSGRATRRVESPGGEVQTHGRGWNFTGHWEVDLMTKRPLADLPITQLLQRVARGDRGALDEICAGLYPELKALARARLYKQGRGDDLETTVVLHETFLRLVAARELKLEDRHHFFAYAARTMRNIIVDSAREALSERRGDGARHEAYDDEHAVHGGVQAELIRVHDALLELEAFDKDMAEVAEMRFFGGYSEAEMATFQGVTVRTVSRRWERARAWLYQSMGESSTVQGDVARGVSEA